MFQSMVNFCRCRTSAATAFVSRGKPATNSSLPLARDFVACCRTAAGWRFSLYETLTAVIA